MISKRAAEVVWRQLSLAGVEVDLETIRSWEPEQFEAAGRWAAATYLHTRGTKGVRVPPKPEFLNAKLKPQMSLNLG